MNELNLMNTLSYLVLSSSFFKGLFIVHNIASFCLINFGTDWRIVFHA